MIVLDAHETDPVTSPERDGVASLADDDPPTIVSISDIHGFLREGRSALLALDDHPDYDPVVEADAARRLHWAGGDEYVLVFNGDLIDRGPQSERVVEMVERLVDEAPPGHVRVTIGNHELGALMPDLYGWDKWYSGQRSQAEIEAFGQQILDGHVVAAYEGYNVVYSHAGQPEPYEAATVNEELVAGTEQLLETLGADDAFDRQEAISEEYQSVLGYAGETGRGPGAGLAWLDFEYMPDDAPPQVIGHTRQQAPVRRENVICENVIRENRRNDGGEAVLVETPDSIVALGRNASDEVRAHEFSMPTLERARQ